MAEFGDQILGLALLCPVAVADHAQRIVPPQIILQKDPDLLASLDPADAVDYEETAVGFTISLLFQNTTCIPRLQSSTGLATMYIWTNRKSLEFYSTSGSRAWNVGWATTGPHCETPRASRAEPSPYGSASS